MKIFPVNKKALNNVKIYIQGYFSYVITFYTLDRICDGLGITLPQFFSEDIGRLELSSEQKKVLETWESLTDKDIAPELKVHK